MRISGNELASLVFGAADSFTENGKTTYYKCTEKQRLSWKAEDEVLYERSLASTGIRLDFHTDSKSFSFKADSVGKFEILLNGRLAFLVSPDSLSADGVCSSFEIGGGEDVRVTLVFPSHDVTASVGYIELDDLSYVRPHEHARKILFIGDSITQGWNSGIDCLSYAWQTTLKLDADSIINGIGGAYFHPDSFDRPDFEPDIVVVAYGTNDYVHYKTLSELRDKAHGFLTAVASAYSGKKLFAVSPIRRWDCVNKAYPMGTFDECRAALINEFEQCGFIHVDGYGLVPNLKQFFADDVHPNALGFCMYADHLTRCIEEKF